MMLRIEIDLDNDAFQDDPYAEIEEIFDTIIEDLPDTESPGSIQLRDSNGNSVGFAKLEAD